MRAPLLILALSLTAIMARADEQLRATQEELRRRNVYFGDIDGRQSEETGEAIKRYQKRKGFATTGRPDRETLRSLGLLAREPGEAPPRELPWPEEPVLKSDVRFEPVEEAREVSRETGIAISALVPVGELKKANAAKASSAKGRRRSGSSRSTAGNFGAATPTPYATRPTGPGIQRMEPSELMPVIKDYLHAASRSDFRGELKYLADRVEYAGHGVVDRRIIERTLRSYAARWPKRSYKLAGAVRYERNSARGIIIATFPVDFTLKRPGTTVRGTTLNRIVWDAATSDPRIVSFQERRLRGG
jgi:peptidoglycan hydrolase-like protein with peptidoglycan-binding domain